jgi:predicted transcriptional regulator
MSPLYEQPMIKLLQVLSPTITWLDSKGSVEVAEVPSDHLDAIKQLERIGIVHKRNNRCYELQKIRLKKLMGSIGIESLAQVQPPSPPVSAQALVDAIPLVPPNPLAPVNGELN